jgi:hypothetical protein
LLSTYSGAAACCHITLLPAPELPCCPAATLLLPPTCCSADLARPASCFPDLARPACCFPDLARVLLPRSKVTKGMETLRAFEKLETTTEGIFVMPKKRVTILSSYIYLASAPLTNVGQLAIKGAGAGADAGAGAGGDAGEPACLPCCGVPGCWVSRVSLGQLGGWLGVQWGAESCRA